MTIALITGPANAGKAEVLLDAVGAHVARGEEPLLVVPTEADQARYRRELAERGLALGVRVERFGGLLAVVVARAGLGEARIGPLVRERMLARLADARPGTASALARLVAELETQRVSAARLRGAVRALRTSGGEHATLERLCELYERYHEALANIKRVDHELRVTRALDALRRQPASWGATPVLLYGFDDLTELQLDAIETLGVAVGARVSVSLAYEPGRAVFAGRAGAFQRLAPLAEPPIELGARAEHYAPASREALHHLERSLLDRDARRLDPGDAVRLLEGGDPRAELELIAGEVRALLDDGVAADQIAIAHRAPETIAGLLGEVLEDFAIPYAMRERVLFAHTAIGRGLLGLLRCSVGSAPTRVRAPGSRANADDADASAPADESELEEGELGDLLAWLRTPGVLDRPELADRLEAIARRQGVSRSERARALWEAEHWPLDRIDRVRQAAIEGTPALVDALVAELQRLFCAPRRAAAAVLDVDELYEARALATSRRALEQLRELARSAPSLAPTSVELADVLGTLEVYGGERPRGGGNTGPGAGGVAVVDPLSLRARRVRMLYVCGLQEGVFPAPLTPQPVLGEEQRRALAHASGLVLRPEPDALAAERYLLYALVSRPEQRLTLSWHTAAEDGAPLAPSLFVDDVCDLFDDTLRERIVRRPAGAASWPGPGAPAGTIGARTLALDGIARATVHDTATVGAGNRTRPHPIQPPRDERVLAALGERVLWSASSLESWAGCPVRWFVERLLRAQDIDPDPEPMARGALAHAALKQTLERLRERTGSARLTSASVGLAKRLLSDALAELEPSHPLSCAPERVPGARRRLAVELERYLECAAEQSSPLEPTHLELEFGFDGGAEALPALDLGEGVLLRGRVDRLDLAPGGEAVVYDYKGRSAPPSAKWLGDGAWQVALYMRAAQSLLGYTPVGGFYQPLAGRDIRARGALDCESGLELDCVRTDKLDGETLAELVEECVAAARAAAGEARSGALQPRPDTCAYGGGCAYPTICRCER